jgi:hypothetical protein
MTLIHGARLGKISEYRQLHIRRGQRWSTYHLGTLTTGMIKLDPQGVTPVGSLCGPTSKYF